MSNQEKMTVDEKRKYLRIVKPRYKQAGRNEKGQILDEMESVTGLDRKTLIRLMKGNLKRKPRSRQRDKTYVPAMDDALRVIYESFDGICAERLTPNLVWMAQNLERHDELTTTPELLEQLGQVSISTVTRRLAHLRQDQPRLPRNPPPPPWRTWPRRWTSTRAPSSATWPLCAQRATTRSRAAVAADQPGNE